MSLKLAKWKWVMLGSVTTVLLIVDQWTKHIVDTRMHLGQSIPVIPGLFSFTYVRNKGAAFGFLHDAPAYFRDPFFVAVPVFALFAVLYLFAKTTDKQKGSAFCLTLVVGGAIGNMIDRMRFGYVIDFLDFFVGQHHWPAFNVADSCIVVGVTVLVIQSFFEGKSQVANGA